MTFAGLNYLAIVVAAVAAVLDRRLSVDAAIESLMTRPLRAEV